MADNVEAHKPGLKTFRLVLIVLGVFATLCVLCGVGWIIARRGTGKQDTGQISGVIPTTDYQNSSGVPISTVADNSPGTPTPPRVNQPIITIYPFIPSPTMTAALQGNADCVPVGKRERGFVIDVLSGDTIRVVVREQTWLVKYLGMKAPSVGLKSTPLAIEALVANRLMVENQAVTMIADVQDIDETKTYMLRYVFLNDLFVNDEILRRGLAQTDSVPPNTACDSQFLKTQQEAIDAHLGVWKDLPPSPTPRSLCDCQGPPRSCDSFRDQSDAQLCFDACQLLGFGDIFNLDPDENGLACSPGL